MSFQGHHHSKETIENLRLANIGKTRRVYTMKDFKRARHLHSKGLPFAKISDKTGIDRSTLTHWILHGVVPRKYSKRAKAAYIKNQAKAAKSRIRKLPESSKILSKELAFIIGVIKGDGTIVGGAVSLFSKDKEFVSEFKKQFEIWSKKPLGEIKEIDLNKKNRKWSKVFYIHIYFKEAATFLSEFDLLNIKKAPDEFRAAYLRGFFDSEGSVLRRAITVCNTNKKLITLCQTLLSSLGIRNRLAVSNRPNYRPLYYLRITSRKYMEMFLHKVEFVIERKQLKLESYLGGFNGRETIIHDVQ